MSNIFFNEIEPFAVEWLRNLYPKAQINAQSIADLQPDDVSGFTRCHFFGGIGGWEYALQLAGWPDDLPVWTGSCPCQPFSAAGKRKGTEDARHLWPEFYRLIRECRPTACFGEQVASKDGRLWLDGVRSDLEGLGYAVGAADLCGASLGAPHIRQRLFWVAHSNMPSTTRLAALSGQAEATSYRREVRPGVAGGRMAGRVAHNSQDGRRQGSEDERGIDRRVQPEKDGIRLADDGDSHGLGVSQGYGFSELKHPRDMVCEAGTQPKYEPIIQADRPLSGGTVSRMGHSSLSASERHARAVPGEEARVSRQGVSDGSVAHGFADAGSGVHWSNSLLIPCRDGKARRISSQPGDEPLAYGIPRDLGRGQPELSRLARLARSNRTGRLRGYGNAIIPQVAALFIRSVMDCLEIDTVSQNPTDGKHRLDFI
jgi:DNA (cytosine-5)-methyltransferase 1